MPEPARSERIAICIACRNEEIALPVMLADLRAQRWPANADVRFTILDDASSDATPAIAARVAAEDRRFQTHRFEERSGQSQAVEWFIRRTEADCLISLDADIRFDDADVLWRLASSIRGGADLASIRQVPLRPRSFWERGAAFSGFLRLEAQDRRPPESTMCTCRGQGVAYGPGMVAGLRSEKWPRHPLGADLFVYCVAMERGMRFALVRDAVVRYRATSDPREFAKQILRNVRTEREVRNRFGIAMARKIGVPPGAMARALLAMTARDPVGATSWAIQRAYAGIKSFRDDNRWGSTRTSKEIGGECV